ncbi:MAG: DUF1328 domain-containing protein [Methanomassiliicoccus sp.]|nr:DUF1328 domain-containing protein [Methanomassiliicoccus sp.]
MNLELAVLFFALAAIAAVLGAARVRGFSLTKARWLIVIFIVLALVALVV